MAAKNVFDTVTITVEIDKRYGVILEASCTLATEHGREYLGRLLRGISIRNGVDEGIELIREHYRGKATNALIACMKDLYKQYELVSA
jgi:hypothetical protein